MKDLVLLLLSNSVVVVNGGSFLVFVFIFMPLQILPSFGLTINLSYFLVELQFPAECIVFHSNFSVKVVCELSLLILCTDLYRIKSFIASPYLRS